MSIRFATLADIPACVGIGQQVHATTRFAALPYDAHRVAQQLRDLIAIGQNQRHTHALLLADNRAGQVVGGLVACLERPLFSPLPVATVAQYLVLPQHRMGGAGLRLLTAFRAWAQQRGAVELHVGINSGTDIARLDRFLRRLGFQPTGGNYAWAMPPGPSGSA